MAPSTRRHILILNGPNLNLLGVREPHIYGHTTLPQVIDTLQTLASSLHCDLTSFQSSSEGAILDHLHSHYTSRPFDFVVINPGALTHTSVALRDALTGINVPFFEVHLTNVHAREEFRARSFLSDKAVGTITGMGVQGYEAAVMFAARYLKEREGEGEKARL